ncbi:MAG: hypothetical protein F4Y02_09125 [Chloroflexi bacterium]|nr:hypothetical protein [Chloroflexota bacterium]
MTLARFGVAALLAACALVLTVLAAVGAGRLIVFEPTTGTVTQRLARIEAFLADHSEIVATDLPKVQSDIGRLAAVVEPATCPTEDEQAYIDELLGDMDALGEAFTAMGDGELFTESLTETATAMANRTPAPTLRGRLLDAEVRRSAAVLFVLAARLDEAVQDVGEDLTLAFLDELAELLTEFLAEFGVMALAVASLCETDSPGRPTVTETPAAP